MPKVSIILPIYNVEQYLSRGIDSILNQTIKDIEVILVDDGSTDNSGIICDMYNQQDNRVKVIHKINGGVSSARNLGIENAKGEFLAFVDPDDTLEIDALEYLYNLAKESHAQIACYKMNTYKNGTLNSHTNEEEVKIFVGEEIIKEYVEKGTFLYSSCNKIYHNKLFKDKDSRFSDSIRYAEDALFNYYMIKNTNKLIFSNLRKYNYFINDNSTVNKVTEKRLDILRSQSEMYDFLEENYGRYTEYITKEYVNSSINIVIDIAREGCIIKKFPILIGIKKRIKKDKKMFKNFSKVGLKEKIFFNVLKTSPVLLSMIYTVKFSLIKNHNNISR